MKSELSASSEEKQTETLADNAGQPNGVSSPGICPEMLAKSELRIVDVVKAPALPPPLMRPGISPETLSDAEIRHVTAGTAKGLVGWSVAGLVIPYFNLDGRPLEVNGKAFHRIRLDQPVSDMKYSQAKGTRVHGYIPRALSGMKIGSTLFIPEGEFKALALCEASFPAAGAGGINNCLVKGGEALVPEFADVIKANDITTVAFVGDSDTALIWQFSTAMVKLAKVLAPVRLTLVRIPVNAPGKGVDDCREALQEKFNPWFQSLVESSVEVPPTLSASALALQLLRREREAVLSLTGEDKSKAVVRLHKLAAGLQKDAAARTEVVSLIHAFTGTPMNAIENEVALHVAKAREKFTKDLTATGRAGAKDKRPLPPIVNSQDLLAADGEGEPVEILAGLIQSGSKVVFASGSKSKKTWNLLSLSLCIAAGQPFWGRRTTKGKVLFVNLEIQEFHFKQRLKALRAHHGITDHTLLDVMNMRGFAENVEDFVPKLIQKVKDSGYSIIIIDPIYKCLGGRDENSAGAMGEFVNQLELIAVETGAALLYAAHFSKGNQAGKSAMDRISGSGVIARDADSIITMTEHEEAGAFVVEATLRNMPETPSFVVRWKYPAMQIDSALDASRLKQARGRTAIASVPELTILLQPKPLTSAEWEAVSITKLNISRRTYFRLRTKAMGNGSVELSGGKYCIVPQMPLASSAPEASSQVPHTL